MIMSKLAEGLELVHSGMAHLMGRADEHEEKIESFVSEAKSELESLKAENADLKGRLDALEAHFGPEFDASVDKFKGLVPGGQQQVAKPEPVPAVEPEQPEETLPEAHEIDPMTGLPYSAT